MLVLTLSALYFLASGIHGAIHQSPDFVPVYTGVRCMFRGCDPYKSTELNQEFLQSGGSKEIVDGFGGWDYDESPLYPPSTLIALAPLGVLKFPAAVWLWCLLNSFLYLIAVALVFSFCLDSHRWAATFFAVVFILGGIALIKSGQVSAFAISTLTIAGALLIRRRCLFLAALLLMLSLAAKPQIGGLVAVYLLMTKVHRRPAAFAVAGSIVFLLIGGTILEARPASRNWLAEMRSNITASMAPGQANDPASASIGEVQLEALTCVLFDDRRTANAVGCGVFILLAAAWTVAALMHRFEPPAVFVILGALLALSLLPIYHRTLDVNLLLLSVPAIAVLFEKRRVLGWFAAVFTYLGAIPVQAMLNGYLAVHAPSLRSSLLHIRFLVFLVLSSNEDLPTRFQHLLDNKLLFLLIFRLQNIALLLLACFYLIAAYTIRFSSPMSQSEVPRLPAQPRKSLVSLPPPASFGQVR